MNKEKLGRVGNFKIIDIEAGDSRAVKDSWFEAYTASNFTMPQTSFFIDVAMVRVLLKDRPYSWSDFSKTVLSKEQLLKLGNMASVGHAHAGVKRATLDGMDHFKDRSEVVPIYNRRIQELWLVSRDHSIKQLVSILKFFRPNDQLPPLDFLEDFLKDLENKKHIAEVTKIIEAIYKAFSAKEIQAELLLYRKNIVAILDNPYTKTKWFTKFYKMVIEEVGKSGVNTNDALVKHILTVFNFLVT